MPVMGNLSGDGELLTVSVAGRFDFSAHAEFRDAYQSHPESVQTIDVNLAATDYIDSSALGMLLVLREYATPKGIEVFIKNASPDVNELLRIANFEQLFEIS